MAVLRLGADNAASECFGAPTYLPKTCSQRASADCTNHDLVCVSQSTENQMGVVAPLLSRSACARLDSLDSPQAGIDTPDRSNEVVRGSWNGVGLRSTGDSGVDTSQETP